jgi:hypothetical protein
MDTRKLVVVGLIALAVLAPAGYWSARASAVRGGFLDAMRAGDVRALPMPLRDKRWTDAELDAAQVIGVPHSPGGERALSGLLYGRGRVHIAPHTYDHQATVEDTATGLRHLFGRTRATPHAWVYVTIHPDSTQRHIELRRRQVEETSGPRAP